MIHDHIRRKHVVQFVARPHARISSRNRPPLLWTALQYLCQDARACGRRLFGGPAPRWVARSVMLLRPLTTSWYEPPGKCLGPAAGVFSAGPLPVGSLGA